MSETDQYALSTNLTRIARQFSIDLSEIADEAVREKILAAAISQLTSRTMIALLRAEQLAKEAGHHHIGTEHVVLAILMDDHAIPTQVLADSGGREEMIRRLQELLSHESYGRNGRRDAGGE